MISHFFLLICPLGIAALAPLLRSTALSHSLERDSFWTLSNLSLSWKQNKVQVNMQEIAQRLQWNEEVNQSIILNQPYDP